MGSNVSKQASPTYTAVKAEPTMAVSDDTELIERLQSLLVKEKISVKAVSRIEKSGEDNPLTSASFLNWESELLSDPKNELALNCFTGNSITDIIAKTKSQYSHNLDSFNYKVDFAGGPITNQRSSGRCWIFASTNVFKSFIKQKYNLDKFEISQNYLFFYDKLEKCNFFLNNIIESYDEEIDSRFIQYLLALPINDGGQWDMIVNLVEKYGLVPHEQFPDSFSSTNSSRLNYIINNKLREYALILRKLASSAANSEKSYEATRASILTVKDSMLKEIFNILTLTLGVAPKPKGEFTWEYFDKFGNFHSVNTTPLGFYNDILGFKANKYFSLINDPRNDYDKLYTVDKLNNVLGGKLIEYVNVDLPVLKQVLIAMIKNNEPAFFGSDVGKFEDTPSGLMDVDSWDYKLGFNTSLNINKRERLLTGSSQMTHAMVITGVHLDADGKPVRWRVENSWGPDVGHKGFFVMTDKWFDEYVFQVVTSAQYAPKKVVDVWKSKEFNVLPYFDPMGALA